MVVQRGGGGVDGGFEARDYRGWVQAGAYQDQVAGAGFVAGPGGGLDGDVAADHVEQELSGVFGDGEGQDAFGSEEARRWVFQHCDEFSRVEVGGAGEGDALVRVVQVMMMMAAAPVVAVVPVLAATAGFAAVTVFAGFVVEE